MLKTILIISTFYVAAYAAGRLHILRSPTSLSFKGNAPLDSESLADVMAASLGMSVTHPSDWTGLYINDPFNPAKGVVTVVINGRSSLDDLITASTQIHTYELIGTGAQESLDSLVFRVKEVNAEVIDLDLSRGIEELAGSILGDIKPTLTKTVSSLKPTNADDKSLLEQISVIDQLTELIQSFTADKRPKFITIYLTVGQGVTIDSTKALDEAVGKLSQTAGEVYNDGAVVAVVTVVNDVVARTKRQASVKSDPLPDPISSLNLAQSYSDDYPVIFNIILWFSVVLTFSLLAISYTIGYMDPGRDSIIYRMTSTRMKKDN